MSSFQVAIFALRRALRAPRLVLLRWGAHILLAALAAYPMLRQLDEALSLTPAGDEFLQRFSLPLFADVARAGGGGTAAFGPLLGVVALLALLWNVFAAGGALETLLPRDPAGVAHRFGRGGGRYFTRFLRMGLAAAPTALLAAVLFAGPVFAVSGALDDSAEGAKYWLGLLGAAAAGFAILLVLLALDLARVVVARDDSERPVRIFFAMLRSTLRRPGRALALWACLAVAFGGVLALYLAFRQLVPAGGAATVFALFVVQQLVMIGRSAMRVALWSGELVLVDRLRPAAPFGERLAAAGWVQPPSA